MSSLLEGIDTGENTSQKKSSGGGGPDPKTMKLVAAVVLFLLAGAILGMNFGVIPSPFGSEVPRDSQGRVIKIEQPSEEEVRKEIERLKIEEQKFIEQGGVVGGA